jgi:hypothetical protein
MELYYKEREVTPDLYSLEYEDKTLFYTGPFAYQKALIHAYDNFITGRIVYCLTLQSQNIRNGFPIKRGRIKKTQLQKLKKQNLTPEAVRPPKNLVQVI